MKLVKPLLILVVLGGAGYYGLKTYLLPTGASWLHGSWRYADTNGHILKGKDGDLMVFHPDGTVDLLTGAHKRYLSCVYTDVVAGEIDMQCEIRGKTRELRFLVNDRKTKLSNTEDTDHGFYIKGVSQ